MKKLHSPAFVFLLALIFGLGCSTKKVVKNEPAPEMPAQQEMASEAPAVEEAPPVAPPSQIEEAPAMTPPPAPPQEEEMPVFIDQTVEPAPGMEAPPAPQVNYVSSDLRKEFPKAGHIRVAKKMGIDIEDIYYYHNMSIINAIFINTEEKLDEVALKKMQQDLYKVFWDFGRSKFTSFVKTDNQFYAVVNSKKDWGEVFDIIVYDYTYLQQAAKGMYQEFLQIDDNPLAQQQLYGVFFDPWTLSTKEQKDLSKAGILIITQKDGQDHNFHQYRGQSNKYHAQMSHDIYLDNSGMFYDRDWGGTLKRTPYGLLRHSDRTSFKEKYASFYLEIDL